MKSRADEIITRLAELDHLIESLNAERLDLNIELRQLRNVSQEDIDKFFALFD